MQMARGAVFLLADKQKSRYNKRKKNRERCNSNMKKSIPGRILKVLLCVLLAVFLIAAIYVAYVFLTFHRLPDQLPLEVRGGRTENARIDTEYKLVSFNTGFGAYEPDYGFFMDGGTQSWAWSKERLQNNLAAIRDFLQEQQADFCLLQEVDEDATRTYHVNERALMEAALADYDSVYAQNWDSAFLMYPLTQPHGKTRCGIMTFSRLAISDALRRSLPIEDSVMKLVDLDRCYSVARVPVENGRELVLVNMHLSAYTSDGTIATRQLEMLLADLAAEYEKGNYVVCGGDFNKDLLGDSSRYFGISGEDYTWAQPIPEEMFAGLPLTLTAASNAPSCRVAEGPYTPQQYVLTLDGFIVSDNVTVNSCRVIDTGFAYSDHNPVEITFSLAE